jgi:hypothetical protein
MTNLKTLTLAAVTALSLGLGTAMAQESAGGVGFGPWETQQLQKALSNMHHGAAVTAQPEAGSSDVDRARTPTYPDAVLSGGGGGN